jgi:hypothetical protein
MCHSGVAFEQAVHLELSAMQLMTLNAVSAGLLVALTSASMAQELLRTRFCIGSGNCPVVVQVMKNCGSDADQIAQEICTVRRGGERRELEYQLLPEGARDGGKCGYSWYTVVCLRDQPPLKRSD